MMKCMQMGGSSVRSTWKWTGGSVTPGPQPGRPHFTDDDAVCSFAGKMLGARGPPFTRRSQISLADAARASVKPKHLDEE